MSLAFVLDEHLRGPLWQAILRFNLSHADDPLNAVCVGDDPELPLGVDDAAILQWAERELRILVTEDRRTIPAQLQQHLQSGRHSPGVLMVRRGASARELLEMLILAAKAGEVDDFADIVTYIP